MVKSMVELIKELRARTGGGGLKECKDALEEANGNVEKAIEILRKAGVVKAAKKSARIATEGVIVIKCVDDCKKAFMIEVNCETDFVARDANFLEFVAKISAIGLEKQASDVNVLLSLPYGNGKTISQAREELVAKIGENINVRRLVFMQSSVILGCYVHGNRIGVLINLSAGNKDLGKDLAMHIAASKPVAIDVKDLAQDLLSKEREIYLEQVKASGKPEKILEKMVEGKMQKFIGEITLLKQPFVKDPDITIEDLLRKDNAKVLEFVRFEVGEGIEKEKSDFASEVMAQVEGKK